jgi:hypothetical protein
MAVADAFLWNILFLLRRHFREILTTWYAARPEPSTGDLVLGWPFFRADPGLHLMPPSVMVG